MHYMGYVFVDEPTRAAVETAMRDHKGEHWDWYRCGGRWDGHFDGEEEMKRRETDNGFNFAEHNNNVERNCKRVSELDPEKPPYFFVAGWYFVPKQYFNEFERSSSGKGYGAILETPHYLDRWRAALAEHSDQWAVVIDAHN